MINILNYLLIFSVFAGAFTLPINVPFDVSLDYIFIALFLIICIYKYCKFEINLFFLLIFFVLIYASLVNVFLENVTLFYVAKQVMGIFITSCAYYLLIKVNNYKIDKLFKIYLRIAVVVAIIGIFQECCYLADFKYGYDYRCFLLYKKWTVVHGEKGFLRVNSILSEPSQFAITMAPAFFVSLNSLFRRNYSLFGKKSSVVVIIAYILTFSLVAYIMISISIFFVFLKKFRRPKYAILASMLLLVFAYASYSYVPDIRKRVDSIIGVASRKEEIKRSHLSFYSLASNTFVALNSFINSPVFGRGLGSHPISYDEFINPYSQSGFWQPHWTGVNKKDASALFLRLVSETGLFGVIAFFYFILKFFVKSSINKNLQLINNSIFILFIPQLFKQGHYFTNGLFFFIWIYYFAYKLKNKPDLEILKTGNH